MIKYHKYSENELLELIRSDNENAFNEIYRRFWSGIFLIARNRLQNDTDAEEITQDIFCNLWKKRAVLNLNKGLKPYLSTAVKYEVINRIVKKKKEDSFKLQFSKVHSDIDHQTLDLLNLNEIQEKLYESIALLPERCQLVFKLRFENGYTQKEIANELEIAEKTVETHLTKARKHIRADFGSSFPFMAFLFINYL